MMKVQTGGQSENEKEMKRGVDAHTRTVCTLRPEGENEGGGPNVLSPSAVERPSKRNWPEEFQVRQSVYVTTSSPPQLHHGGMIPVHLPREPQCLQNRHSCQLKRQGFTGGITFFNPTPSASITNDSDLSI